MLRVATTLATLCLVSSTLSFGMSPDAIVRDLEAQKADKGWTFDVGLTSMLEIPEGVGTGFARPLDWEKNVKFVVPPVVESLPTAFDWREKGVVGPIRDQALPQYCGSCWAHGTTTAFEGAIALKTGKVPNISPQQLVSCRPSYGTCGGGYVAFGFYEQVGANYEDDFPYAAADVSCNTTAAKHERASDWGYIGSSGREPTTDEIKRAIYTYGPVAVTVASSRSWGGYRGGVYNACDSFSINHIVALVGWNDADQTWIVKNSHGTAWGEQGYMRTKWTDSNGQKCNGIGESAAWVVYNP